MISLTILEPKQSDWFKQGFGQPWLWLILYGIHSVWQLLITFLALFWFNGSSAPKHSKGVKHLRLTSQTFISVTSKLTHNLNIQGSLSFHTWLVNAVERQSSSPGPFLFTKHPPHPVGMVSNWSCLMFMIKVNRPSWLPSKLFSRGNPMRFLPQQQKWQNLSMVALSATPLRMVDFNLPVGLPKPEGYQVVDQSVESETEAIFLQTLSLPLVFGLEN